jgi:hypothetical protein
MNNPTHESSEYWKVKFGNLLVYQNNIGNTNDSNSPIFLIFEKSQLTRNLQLAIKRIQVNATQSLESLQDV